MRRSVSGSTCVEVERKRGEVSKKRIIRILNYGQRPKLAFVVAELDRLDPGEWDLDDGDVFSFREL